MADARLRLIVRAATNNAALCDAVCRSHGIAGRTAPDAWTSAVRTPPGYPDAVTLSPSVDRDRLLDQLDDGPGCSVKDSFATLDLAVRPGWSVLFEATWLARRPPIAADEADPAEGSMGAHGRWEAVDDADALARWAAAWADGDADDGRWRAGVLDQDLVVLAGADGGVVDSGAIVNVSDDVVGVSNLFATSDATDPWRSCLAWIGEHLPGRTVVGYESGTDLTAALDHGFEPIGPLRVWRRDGR